MENHPLDIALDSRKKSDFKVVQYGAALALYYTASGVNEPFRLGKNRERN